MGYIVILIITFSIIISLFLLIETFVMFCNIKDIKTLLIEQNEKTEALVKLGIMIKNQNESKKD